MKLPEIAFVMLMSFTVLLSLCECLKYGKSYEYCLRFNEHEGMNPTEFREVLPGALYEAFPANRFIYNCSSPDRITIHSRNTIYKVQNKNISGRFLPDQVAQAWVDDKAIVFNRAYEFSVYTQLEVIENGSNVIEPRTSDWCFGENGESTIQTCQRCIARLGYDEALCRIKTVSIEDTIAEQMGFIVNNELNSNPKPFITSKAKVVSTTSS